MNPEAQCPHCGEEESVTTHLFFSCHFATQIWEKVPCKSSLNVNSISNLRQGLEAAKSLTCLPPTGIGAGPLAPWILWSSRKIFNQQIIQSEEAVLQAILRAKEWQIAQAEKEPDQLTKDLIIKPRLDQIEVTCTSDAAWRDDYSAGFGWSFSRLGTQVHHGSAALTCIRGRSNGSPPGDSTRNPIGFSPDLLRL